MSPHITPVEPNCLPCPAATAAAPCAAVVPLRRRMPSHTTPVEPKPASTAPRGLLSHMQPPSARCPTTRHPFYYDCSAINYLLTVPKNSQAATSSNRTACPRSPPTHPYMAYWRSRAQRPACILDLPTAWEGYKLDCCANELWRQDWKGLPSKVPISCQPRLSFP